MWRYNINPPPISNLKKKKDKHCNRDACFRFLTSRAQVCCYSNWHGSCTVEESAAFQLWLFEFPSLKAFRGSFYYNPTGSQTAGERSGEGEPLANSKIPQTMNYFLFFHFFLFFFFHLLIFSMTQLAVEGEGRREWLGLGTWCISFLIILLWFLSRLWCDGWRGRYTVSRRIYRFPDRAPGAISLTEGRNGRILYNEIITSSATFLPL